jgi:hypothetical protein
VLLQAVPGDPDRLRQVSFLAQLLRQLREQAGARILVDPLPEVIDAGVASQENL